MVELVLLGSFLVFLFLFVFIDFGFNINEHVSLRLLSPLGGSGLGWSVTRQRMRCSY